MTFLEQTKTLEQIKKEWVEQCFNKSKSANSKRGAIETLGKFTRFLKEKHPSYSEDQIMADLKDLSDKREVKLYLFLNEFIQWLIAQDYGSRSISHWFMFLKNYLRYNGIRIYNEDIKSYVRIPKPLKERKKPLDHQTIKTLISRCGPFYAAFILVLVSSGMRVGELIRLKVSKIDMKKEPWMIEVMAENAKMREERRTFISHEAMAALKLILNDSKPNDLVFDFGTEDYVKILNNIESWFSDLRQRLGIKERYSNGFHHVRIHAFRNFFISQTEKIHEGFGHALAGHGRYMDEYENYTDDELREFYLKVEAALTVDGENREKAKNATLTNELQKVNNLQALAIKLQDKIRRLEMRDKKH